MDFMILDGIQKLHSPFLDTFFVFVTHLGDKGIIWCVLALVLLLIPGKRKIGAACIMALLLAQITGNQILKPMFARVRPCDLNQAVQLLIPYPGGYSFPSGHTAASFGAAGAIWFLGEKKWGAGAFALAFLIAFSRMYLYVHFPTDILAGVLLGLLSGSISVWCVNRVTDKRKSINIKRK